MLGRCGSVKPTGRPGDHAIFVRACRNRGIDQPGFEMGNKMHSLIRQINVAIFGHVMVQCLRERIALFEIFLAHAPNMCREMSLRQELGHDSLLETGLQRSR